jgi:hypothetical protein
MRARTKAREQATLAAERCFRRAIEVTPTHGGRWFELRARLGLVRLQPARERGGGALRRLRELHASIDDGSDVAGLRDVRDFLAGPA